MSKRITKCRGCKSTNYLKEEQKTNTEGCWFCGELKLEDSPKSGGAK